MSEPRAYKASRGWIYWVEWARRQAKEDKKKLQDKMKELEKSVEFFADAHQCACDGLDVSLAKETASAARVKELDKGREADDLAYIAVVEVMQAAQAENKRLREALEYIARRNYTGASFVALEALKEKP
jgi:cell division septum initiation protein DivIVA